MRAPVLATIALLAALASLTIGATACDPHEARSHRAPPAAPPATLPAEPAPPEPLPDPTPLADEVGSHETVAACRARVRAAIAPDVAELLGELGYDTAPDDVCLALDAVRRGDPAACDALSVSTVRRGCRRRVAIAHGVPDACPDDLVVAGREPVCLAWASRDVGLCRGAGAGEQPRCRAVLANDAHACHVPASHDAASCERDVRRFGSLIAGAAPVRSASRDVTPAFEVTLRGSATTVARASATVERGVVLATCAGRVRFTLGPSHREEGLPHFVDSPVAWLDVLAQPGDDGRSERIPLGGPAANASLVVVLPHDVGVTSELGAVAGVTHEPIRVARGALLAGAIDGTMPNGRETVHVSGTFRTFVRDVVEQAPPCRR